jgi:hypothetical protein
MDGPSAQIIAAAATTCSVRDAGGRTLLLRRPGALDKLRLFKAAGPALAQNQPWLGMAMLACAVVAIDDIPVPAPLTEQQIEGLVSRLGDAGIAAVASALSPAADHDPEVVAAAGN